MEIIYQVSNYWEEEQVNLLALNGIDVKPGYGNYRLKESEFQIVKNWLENWKVIIGKGASFSKKELDSSQYLSLDGIRDYGYPQPFDDLGYIDQVFCNVCPKCHTPVEQKNPFRIKGEPRWGKSRIFSLTGEPDKLFVEKEFYTEVFKPFGIESLPVIIHRSGKTAESVVQLKLPIVKEELDMRGMAYKECPVCLRKRYESVVLDFLPGFKTTIDYPIFYGNEFYGTHRSGYRRIFVSQDFRRILTKLKQVNPELYTPTR